MISEYLFEPLFCRGKFHISVGLSFDDAFAVRVRDYNEEMLSCFPSLIEKIKFTNRLWLLIRASMSYES